MIIIISQYYTGSEKTISYWSSRVSGWQSHGISLSLHFEMRFIRIHGLFMVHEIHGLDDSEKIVMKNNVTFRMDSILFARDAVIISAITSREWRWKWEILFIHSALGNIYF